MADAWNPLMQSYRWFISLIHHIAWKLNCCSEHLCLVCVVFVFMCVCSSVIVPHLAARMWDRRSRWSGGVRVVRGQCGQLQSTHEEEPPRLRPQRQPARLPQQRLLRWRLVRRRMWEWKPLLPAVWWLQREVPGHQKQGQSPHRGEVRTPERGRVNKEAHLFPRCFLVLWIFLPLYDYVCVQRELVKTDYEQFWVTTKARLIHWAFSFIAVMFCTILLFIGIKTDTFWCVLFCEMYSGIRARLLTSWESKTVSMKVRWIINISNSI